MVLGLIQFASESQEDKVRDRARLEQIQNILLSAYIAVMAVVFMIYLLKTSCARLATVILHDKGENRFAKLCPRCTPQNRTLLCCGDCKPSSNSRVGTRFCFCLVFSFCSIIRRLLCVLCKNVQCCPCVCCRRQGHLACGLFIRIFIRELLAACGTLAVVLSEEPITNLNGIKDLSPFARTSILIMLAFLAHVVGYIIGVCVGRWADAMCHVCCRACCRTSASDFP